MARIAQHQLYEDIEGEIYTNMQQLLSEERKDTEPKSKYDFCLRFSKITKRPLGMFLRATKHYPISWFLEIQSLCKGRTPVEQAKTVNWYVREARLKKI